MMHYLSSRNFVTAMSAENLPAAVVESGNILLVETMDCFGNRFYREEEEGEPAADNPGYWTYLYKRSRTWRYTKSGDFEN